MHIGSQKDLNRLYQGHQLVIRAQTRRWRPGKHYQITYLPVRKADDRIEKKVAGIRARVITVAHDPDDDTWLFTIEADRSHQTRLLGRTGSPGVTEEDDISRGYTDRTELAVTDAGEAVDDDTLKQYLKDAAARQTQRAADPYLAERRTILQALERIENGVIHDKVQHEIELMRRRLHMIDRHLKAS